MIKRIALTGATSSLGTAIVEECIKQNIEVLAIANPGSKNLGRINQSDNVKTRECALSEIKNFYDDLQCDVFIHLAWAATAGDLERNRLADQAKNVEYALDAVDLAERLKCSVFVGAGSQAEYGRTEMTLTEDLPANPETAYGIAKLSAGMLTRLACRQKGIRHIWPRILSAYGPKCQPQSVINYTLTELLAGRKPSLSGGEQIWDFIYTGDVARALLLLAENGVDGEVYVIGSGKSKPLKEFLFEARDIVDKEIELGLGEKPYGEKAVMHLSCDISKLERDTGFKAETSFEDGIKKTIEWLKEEA